MSDPEHHTVDPNALQPGPIRHETLPPELLEHIRAVYEAAVENQQSYDSRRKLVHCSRRIEAQWPLRYCGADDQAGPNYTKQPVVDSHYVRRIGGGLETGRAAGVAEATRITRCTLLTGTSDEPKPV